jgi:hypothetical protein
VVALINLISIKIWSCLRSRNSPGEFKYERAMKERVKEVENFIDFQPFFMFYVHKQNGYCCFPFSFHPYKEKQHCGRCDMARRHNAFCPFSSIIGLGPGWGCESWCGKESRQITRHSTRNVLCLKRHQGVIFSEEK